MKQPLFSNPPLQDVLGDTEVSSKQGQDMADTIGAAAYVECSAKTGEGVEHVFMTAVRQRKPRQGRRRARCSVL